MRKFNFIDSGEDAFRFQHQHVYERKCICSNAFQTEDPCSNICHYLISSDFSDNGYPPVFGIDCEIEVLCWGGDDIDNSTKEAYCNQCVAIQKDYTREQNLREEKKAQQLCEEAERRRVAEAQQKRTLREFWMNLDALAFEKNCALLFVDLGYSAQTTSRTNDGAVDILLEKDGKKGAAQCKAWIQACGVKELREFYGALHTENMTFGYFIARSGITRSASLLLKKMPLLQCWTIDDILSYACRVNN